MAVFKCKMCGGALEIVNNETVAECEYCGTKQTLPRLNDDRKANLIDRANHFRRSNEFDKAAGIYEQILNEDTTDAESYWSLVLCRFGIEYVEDPATHKRVPTVNRAQFTSIFDDNNYKSALQYADEAQKAVYEDEAKAINEIQKGILAISQKEEPFDVFICYKETDADGRRTQDSVIANELYHELTREGYKVFFSRITLEDKLGTAYEPYIFAALNSAKVMVVIGTKPEYFNAVWVKNEWSRFLSFIRGGAKKILIPAYRDMDPYDLPDEFSHLQAQDMSKLGFMQDLIRGINKLAKVNEPKPAPAKTASPDGGNVDTFLKRAFMALEDGEWNDANKFLEKVLNIDAELPAAYLGKLLAELKVHNKESLVNCNKPFDNSNNYRKLMRFADSQLADELRGYIQTINNRNYTQSMTELYDKALAQKQNATTQDQFMSAGRSFEKISEWKDAAALAKECYEEAGRINSRELDTLYMQAVDAKNKANNESSYKAASDMFRQISGWKDAEAQADECYNLGEACRIKLVKKRKAKRITKRLIKLIIFLAIVIGGYFFIKSKVDDLSYRYNQAVALMEEESYEMAYEMFDDLDNYKDSREHKEYCQQQMDILLQENLNASAGVAAGSNFSVGINEDGKVLYFGSTLNIDEDRVSEWENIVAVSAGSAHVVALDADGNVFASGLDEFGQCDVSEWTDIKAIEAGHNHTVGLKKDGTVVATGNYDIAEWTDIKEVAAGNNYIIGLKKDGTVVATGNNSSGQCDVSEWTDIIAIEAGYNHTVALKSDGTVISTGNNNDGRCDVSEWTDIVAIEAGDTHTVGLKSDGSVVATGKNDYSQCDVYGFYDVVAISASATHTIGVKSDGSIFCAGSNEYGQLDIADNMTAFVNFERDEEGNIIFKEMMGD